MIKSLSINGIRSFYILITAIGLITFYVVINLLPISWATHELFNSLFSTTLTFLTGLYVFLNYRYAKQNQIITSRFLFWLSLSFLSWFIADVLWLWLIAIKENPYPSPADFFYFVMYPLFILSIFTIPSTLSPARGIKRITIEVSILILAALLFFLFLVLIPGQPVYKSDNFSLFITFLYPVLDIVIIWIILILYFSNNLKSTKKLMKFFIFGIISFTVSDLLYFINSIFENESQGYFIDLGYYIFYFIISLAALYSFRKVSLKTLPKEKPTVTLQTGKWISFIPGIFLISVVGFILIFVFDQFSISNTIPGILIALIFLLFIFHQYLVITENIRLNIEMSRINIELERKVFQRTTELKLTNNELQNEIRYRKETEEILTQSEAKYRLIAENTSDVIWVMNAETLKFNYLSPSVFSLTGYNVEEAMNLQLTDLLTPQSVELVKNRLKERLDRLIKENKSEISSIDELQQICKDGSIVWIEIVSSIMFNNQRNGVDIIGVSRNIEQRKKAEFQIQQKNIELEELNATKDKFFSIIAHDLKSPFNAIVGFSELLNSNLENYSTEKIKKYASAINNSSKLTFKLLENLLEWSSLQRGKISLNLQYQNFNTIVDEIVLLNNEMALKKNIVINNKILPELSFYFDSEITKTILRNLITNAIKYTDISGIIAIGIKKNESNYEIQVTDNGVGILPDKIPFLFSIDQDISTSGTANEKGTGLGLLLSKELVEKQGGNIWVESVVGKGSSFYFTIPIINYGKN